MQTYYVIDDLNIIEKVDGKVDSIFFDLENLGKIDRQPSNFIVSKANFNDLKYVRKKIKKSEMMVRINPIHENTATEVHICKEAGADIIMLPYFKTLSEVQKLIRYCGSSMKICLLVETPEAVLNLRKILHVCKIDRVHFGLNDLRLALGRDNIFEAVFDDLLCSASRACLEFNVPFGIGGIGRIGLENPTPEDYIARCRHMGAIWIILNRSFIDYRKIPSAIEFATQFDVELKKINRLFENLSIHAEQLRQLEVDVVRERYLKQWYGEAEIEKS